MLTWKLPATLGDSAIAAATPAASPITEARPGDPGGRLRPACVIDAHRPAT